MQRRELERALRKAGFICINGGNHDKFVKEGTTVIVPRHREISEGLAKAILSQAGLR